MDALAQSNQSAQRNNRRSNRRSSIASSSLNNPNITITKLQFELTIRKLFIRDSPNQVEF